MLMERLWVYFKKEVKQQAGGISCNPLAPGASPGSGFTFRAMRISLFKGWRMDLLFIVWNDSSGAS